MPNGALLPAMALEKPNLKVATIRLHLTPLMLSVSACLGDINMSESVDIQPTIGLGIGEKVEGETNNSIGIGVNFQIYFDKEIRNFFIGPSLGMGFSLEDIDTDESSRGLLSGGIILGYDFSNEFTAMASFSTNLTNPSKISGVKINSSAFGISLQYKIFDPKKEKASPDSEG